MKKKHLCLLISALLMTNFAFGCAPKAPEDRIVKIIDALHSKYLKATDCDKLAADLHSYCKDNNNAFVTDYKAVLAQAMANAMISESEEEPPALLKIEAALDKLDDIEASACAEHEKAAEALGKCLAPLEIELLDMD